LESLLEASQLSGIFTPPLGYPTWEAGIDVNAGIQLVAPLELASSPVITLFVTMLVTVLATHHSAAIAISHIMM